MNSKPNAQTILEIRNLKKYFVESKRLFSTKKNVVKAVDDVSLSLKQGEVLALVGESGSGKTTLGRTVARLYEPTDGQITYRKFGPDNEVVEEKLLGSLNAKELKQIRQDICVVFQDPFSSLNPRWTVKGIIAEPLILQGSSNSRDIDGLVAELLRKVGLSPDHMQRYPHEFSGGQRQRIGIARALALSPKIVIADEPVSALDVSIQAQILNLLEDLREDFNFTSLFIAHDLLVVEYVSDRIAVMYLGKIMEVCETDELFRRPLHPYTEALLSAVPVPNPRYKMKRILLKGDIPSPMNTPSGCPFHTRCHYAKPGLCDVEVPQLTELETNHSVACLRVKEIELKGLEDLLSAVSG